jgi:hypothetical protein
MSTSSSGCIPCPALPSKREIHRTAAQPRRGVVPQESFEDFVYSLIAASVIVALLLGILGQLESPTSRAQSVTMERTSIIERAWPDQGKDGKF